MNVRSSPSFFSCYRPLIRNRNPSPTHGSSASSTPRHTSPPPLCTSYHSLLPLPPNLSIILTSSPSFVMSIVAAGSPTPSTTGSAAAAASSSLPSSVSSPSLAPASPKTGNNSSCAVSCSASAWARKRRLSHRTRQRIRRRASEEVWL